MSKARFVELLREDYRIRKTNGWWWAQGHCVYQWLCVRELGSGKGMTDWEKWVLLAYQAAKDKQEAALYNCIANLAKMVEK